jgi:uncharacterized protein (DUF2267 family)
MAELIFITKVAEHAQVPEEQASSLTEAVLRVLALRLSGGQARDLADRMPDPLRPFLITNGENAEAFSMDEFIDRVAAQAGVSEDIARRGTAGVLHAMRAEAGHREFEDMRAQLPGDFAALLPAVTERARRSSR